MKILFELKFEMEILFRNQIWNGLYKIASSKATNKKVANSLERVVSKVIIEKSRGEVSPMGQDTIEKFS